MARYHGTPDFIAVCQLKGGTGRTTLSTNLAYELLTRGKDVSVIDGRGRTAILKSGLGRRPAPQRTKYTSKSCFYRAGQVSKDLARLGRLRSH